MIRGAALLVGGAAVLCAACGDPASVERLNTLTEAQQRWNQHNIDSYEFTVAVSCFCGQNYPIRVTVQNDAPVAVVRADSGTAVDTTNFRDYLTIDRIFTKLHGALAQGPDTYAAVYDETTGYPKNVSIDFVASAADDELGIAVTTFAQHP